jgi:hypothetical protein
MIALAVPAFSQTSPYPWLAEYDSSQALENRIPAPEGFERIAVGPGSFAQWLRGLPLKRGTPPVLLYDARRKRNQRAHYAVVDIDVGGRDLQQCADAVMRFRAEYLYSTGKHEAIHFNFTSGDRADFTKWAEGYRPVVNGNDVRWTKSAEADSSHSSFRAYMDRVFAYAGSYSLNKELTSVEDVSDMRIGDVFIQGGFPGRAGIRPGHAIIVVDMAVHKENGKKLFLLAQSYMPAQDIHILRNPKNDDLNPWYELDFEGPLLTPEWIFTKDDLKRF